MGIILTHPFTDSETRLAAISPHHSHNRRPLERSGAGAATEGDESEGHAGSGRDPVFGSGTNHRPLGADR